MIRVNIDNTTINQAADLLTRAAPGATVILFGSHARGEARYASDLDLLVVEPELQARREEVVRLKDVLRPLNIPVDLLVVSRRTWDGWSHLPGTVLHEAKREGKVLRGSP